MQLAVEQSNRLKEKHFPLEWDRKTVRSCLLTTKQNIGELYYAQIVRLPSYASALRHSKT
jgi:hypothetical protein